MSRTGALRTPAEWSIHEVGSGERGSSGGSCREERLFSQCFTECRECRCYSWVKMTG